MIRSIQHVGLMLPNPDQATQFYKAFGLDVQEKHGRVVARCAGRDQDQVVVTEGPKKGLHYVSFSGDPAIARTKLEQRAIQLLDPPYDGAPQGIWFKDLDGNLIHLGTEASAPSRAADRVHINTHSARVRINERGCLPFGTDPKPIRLGHIILFSPQPANQVKFYTDVLGMKISDQVAGGFITFMRGAADGDHHLVGILTSHAPGLHHMSYEMDSFDHMQLGARRIVEAGFQHVWGTGRHSIGSNLFHYFRDPWGSMAEYFYDLDWIPEGAAWEARDWPKEQGLFLWSSDGPPPPDFPKNIGVP
ncbi:MAG: VOC family protein [Kofleriaceae bacterium]